MPQPHHSSAVNSFYPSAQPCSVWRGTALAAPSLSPRAGGHGSEGAPQVTPASPPWSPSNWAPSPAHQGSALHDHNTPTSLGSTYTLTGGVACQHICSFQLNWRHAQELLILLLAAASP